MLNNKQREYVKYAYGLFNKDVLTRNWYKQIKNLVVNMLHSG